MAFVTKGVHSPLCYSFLEISRRTWRDLSMSESAGFSLGEESITDFNLLYLLRHHPQAVVIQKFNRFKESRVTGADWEWFIGGTNGWIAARVQAKKLNATALTYDYLDHNAPKSHIPQVDMLIKDANANGMFPLYCFYNFWDVAKFAVSQSYNRSLNIDYLFGCTVADANVIKRLIVPGGTPLSVIEPMSLPWASLVCWPGGGDNESGITEILTKALSKLPKRITRVPELLSELPPYASKLRDSTSKGALDIAEERPDLDGILIINEDKLKLA